MENAISSTTVTTVNSRQSDKEKTEPTSSRNTVDNRVKTFIYVHVTDVCVR